jgi:hypothetical protein
LALFHSIFSSVSHYFRQCFIVFFFIAVSQCFWRCFTIFVIAVLNNYWHCFQLYSGPCFCTVLFSAIFQLYSWSYYCPALFLPFPALFQLCYFTALILAMLPFSIIPGHFKFYSLLCYCTALLPAICLLFAGNSSQSIIVICLLFAGCSSPSKQ